MPPRTNIRSKIKAINFDDSLLVKTGKELYSATYPERGWLIEPWLRERMLVLVHAPTGVGKSWFCWAIALGITSGKGFADWKCPEPKKVLIIDGEMQSDDLQDRYKFLIKHAGFSKKERINAKNNLSVISRQDQNIDTNFPDLHEEDGQYKFLEEIQNINPDLVILDNLSTLANLPDENAASSYNSIFGFLTKLKQQRSGILVHHDRKGTDENTTEGYRGSSKMAAIFEQRIHISQVKDHKKPKGVGACFYSEFQKNRYLGDASLKRRIFALHPDNGWDVEEDEDESLVSFSEAVKSCKFTTQDELGEHFGHKRSWANKMLRKCYCEEYLTEGDWFKYSNKAKDLKKLEKMSDKQLDKLDIK